MTEKQGFWTSLPGILTGIAAVVTSLTGLYVAVANFTPEISGTNKQVEEQVEEQVVTNIGIAAAETPSQAPRVLTKEESEELETEQSKAPKQINEEDYKAFPQTGPLVICEHFPSANSVESLMSWSNHYHKNIIDPKDYQPKHACDKAIGYRASAHCMQPENAEIRKSLLETLTLCRKIGLEWHQATAQ
jgi:hypothetical protein